MSLTVSSLMAVGSLSAVIKDLLSCQFPTLDGRGGGGAGGDCRLLSLKINTGYLQFSVKCELLDSTLNFLRIIFSEKYDLKWK